MKRGSDSVRVVIFAKDDPISFLVLCESDDLGNWKLPGGKFEGSESPDEAAARELEEELALQAQAVGLGMAGELVNDDGVSKRFIYRAVAERDTPQPSDEIAEVKWIQEDQIPESKNRSHILTALQTARGDK